MIAKSADMHLLDNIFVKFGAIIITGTFLSYGQVCLARFARELVFHQGFGALVASAVSSRTLYLMVAVNGVASIGYMLLTRRYPLSEVFVTNLVVMALCVALAAQFLMDEPFSARRAAGYGLAIVAVFLLQRG